MARPRVSEVDALLDAAVRRLTASGLAATTIDDIAAEAGVSRATVYRYLGGKQDIVQAVIVREAEVILERAGAAIVAAPTVERAIDDAVVAILAGVQENPLLARLTSVDLVDTLRHLTVDSAPLITAGVQMLGPAYRRAPLFEVDDRMIDEAIEEAGRFVFSHLTTPRRGGKPLSHHETGKRAALLLAPLMRGDAEQ